MAESHTTRVAIHGAAARMAQRLVALAEADPQCRLTAALEAEGHPQLGRDAGAMAGIGEIGVPLSARIDDNASVDVVIDFSVPAAAARIVENCRAAKLPIVVAKVAPVAMEMAAQERRRVKPALSDQIVDADGHDQLPRGKASLRREVDDCECHGGLSFRKSGPRHPFGAT